MKPIGQEASSGRGEGEGETGDRNEAGRFGTLQYSELRWQRLPFAALVF